MITRVVDTRVPRACPTCNLYKVAECRLLASEPVPCARGRASPHVHRRSWPSESDNYRTTSSDFAIWTHCQFIRDDVVIKTNARLTVVSLFFLLERPPNSILHLILQYRRVPPEETTHALCLFTSIHHIRRLYNHHLRPTSPPDNACRDRNCTIHTRRHRRIYFRSTYWKGNNVIPTTFSQPWRVANVP